MLRQHLVAKDSCQIRLLSRRPRQRATQNVHRLQPARADVSGRAAWGHGNHRRDRRRLRTFASAAEPDARRIAALLGFHYRRLEDGSFDHSQIITLLDGEGRVVASTTKLIGDADFEAKLRAITAAGGP